MSGDISSTVVIEIYSRQVSTLIVAWGKKLVLLLCMHFFFGKKVLKDKH